MSPSTKIVLPMELGGLLSGLRGLLPAETQKGSFVTVDAGSAAENGSAAGGA
jgi:hypothetical protein